MLKVGDKVDALVYPDKIVIGILHEIRDYMGAVKNSADIIQWTPLVMIKKID